MNFYHVRAFPASTSPKAERAATSLALGRADPGQQQPARRRRPGGRALPRALRQRPAQLGVQVPPPRDRRRRTGRARRPDADRAAAAEVRLPRRPGANDEPASSTASTTPTPRRPSGTTSRSWSGSGHARRGRAEDGFPKTADDLYRYHAIDPRRPRGRLLHAGPARARCEIS